MNPAAGIFELSGSVPGAGPFFVNGTLPIPPATTGGALTVTAGGQSYTTTFGTTSGGTTSGSFSGALLVSGRLNLAQ